MADTSQNKRYQLAGQVRAKLLEEASSIIENIGCPSVSDKDAMNRMSCALSVASYLSGGMGRPAFTDDVQGCWVVTDEDLEYMASDAFTLASAVEAQCSQFPESSMRWGSLMSESDAIWHAIVSGSRYESA